MPGVRKRFYRLPLGFESQQLVALEELGEVSVSTHFALRYQCQGCKQFYYTGRGKPPICRECGATVDIRLVVVKVYVESSPWYTLRWEDKETIEFVRPYLITVPEEFMNLRP